MGRQACLADGNWGRQNSAAEPYTDTWHNPMRSWGRGAQKLRIWRINREPDLGLALPHLPAGLPCLHAHPVPRAPASSRRPAPLKAAFRQGPPSCPPTECPSSQQRALGGREGSPPAGNWLNFELRHCFGCVHVLHKGNVLLWAFL